MQTTRSIHETAGAESWLRGCGVSVRSVRRIRHELYKVGRRPRAILAGLPDGLRREVERGIEFHALRPSGEPLHGPDGSTRMVFATAAGLTLETVVLRLASGRTTVCVSSQIGCAAGCRFCATGGMGLAVDLAAGEILDQVIRANLELSAEGRRVRNVVFMGMGEPLHNESAVHQALDVLLSPRCFGLSPRHVTVSTVGVPDAMVRLVERHPGIGLALSLHSARQDVRQSLIPLARRHDLRRLRDAILAIGRLERRPLMIEYLMLDGHNDRPDDLAALLEYLSGLPVRVNLIPFNPIETTPELRGSAEAVRETFANALRAAGFEVTIRHSLGGDLRAACGQLTRPGNREALRRSRRRGDEVTS